MDKAINFRHKIFILTDKSYNSFYSNTQKMTKKELWLRIKAYQFNHIVPAGLLSHIAAIFGGDSSSEKAFAAKIARKHNWPNRFASKAVFEYKKFVYLGVVSDFTVTPSKIIDVVWHEHLLFTKAYREFCDTVIKHAFDHNPELLPMQDQTGQYNAQYLDTLDLYALEFGTVPPEAVWGVAKFDKDKVANEKFRSKKKDQPGTDASTYGDTPLISHFDSDVSDNKSFPEFNDFGDGDFGGAGSDGRWDAGDSSDNDSSSDSGGDAGGDSGGCSGGCGGGD